MKTDFTGSHHRFDQCGIVMYLDSENWLKGSVEYENEQFQHLGSVVTNHGFPVWAGNITPPIRTFVIENNLKGKRIAAFACQSGSGAEKAFGILKAAIGIEKLDAELILIDPKMKPPAGRSPGFTLIAGSPVLPLITEPASRR